MFAFALSDSKIQNKQIQEPTNHPYSLMEGLAGEVLFLSQILNDEEEARFPGFEI